MTLSTFPRDSRIAELEPLAPRADLEALAAPVVAHYDLAAGSTVELVNVSENATFRIREPAGGRTLFLRAHRNGYHTLQEIASELAWTAALRAEAGIGTPVVVKTRGGADLLILRGAPLPDERYCVLFEQLQGDEPSNDRLTEWCGVLGETAARMHRHGAAWTPPAWFSRPVWDLETITGALGRWGRWQESAGLDGGARDLLERAEARIRTRLDAFGRASDRYGLIHADLRLGNTFATGEHLALIDFDDCGYGWFLWDLATLFTFIEHRADVPDAVGAWLDGYRRVAPLAPGSEDVVPDLLMLRRLQVLAWLAWHAETPLAQAESAEYTGRTLELADRYLQVRSR